MNYGWAKNFVLQLLNQYSRAGEQVAATYNGQSDDIARIPALLNDAQIYAATAFPAGRIRTVDTLDAMPCKENNNWNIYDLPKNFFQLFGGGLIRTDGKDAMRFAGYRLIGRDALAIPGDAGTDFLVEYYRYPRVIGLEPEDTLELDNSLEVQAALPYYAAAHLAADRDPFLYQVLMNEFENRMARMTGEPHAEVLNIEDVYGFGGC